MIAALPTDVATKFVANNSPVSVLGDHSSERATRQYRWSVTALFAFALRVEFRRLNERFHATTPYPSDYSARNFHGTLTCSDRNFLDVFTPQSLIYHTRKMVGRARVELASLCLRGRYSSH